MIIDCISDLHGYQPKLDGADLLIIAGDLTARDTREQYFEFLKAVTDWSKIYKMIIIIAGNHDNRLQSGDVQIEDFFLRNDVQTGEAKKIKNVKYLCDSGIEFGGLKIWGSPWTRRFSGQNPDCMAFSVKSEFQLKDYFDLIPNDINILVTHSPPYGILDTCSNGRVGSEILRQALFRIKPKLMVFGHIHENGGKELDLTMTRCVNASCVNEYYQHVNKPVRIIYGDLSQDWVERSTLH